MLHEVVSVNDTPPCIRCATFHLKQLRVHITAGDVSPMEQGAILAHSKDLDPHQPLDARLYERQKFVTYIFLISREECAAQSLTMTC